MDGEQQQGVTSSLALIGSALYKPCSWEGERASDCRAGFSSPCWVIRELAALRCLGAGQAYMIMMKGC